MTLNQPVAGRIPQEYQPVRKLALTLAAVMAVASSQAALAQTRIQTQPANPTPSPMLQKKAPAPGKPDLVISRAAVIGPDMFKFYVENKGNAPSWQAAVKVENATSGGVGNQNIRGIQAGSGMWIEVRIWPNVKAGDKIELYADIGNKITESNEANNAYSFNW